MAMVSSFAVLMLVFLLAGAAAARARRRAAADYLLASRQAGPMSVGLSAMASTASGFAFTGLVAFIYLQGYSGAWLPLGMIFGSLAGLALAARRFRTLGARGGAMSYPEYLAAPMGRGAARFGMAAGLLVVAIAIIYGTAQLAAGSKALQVLMGWHHGAGVLLGAALVLVYCWAGGIRASISTDVAQSVVMLSALAILTAVAVARVGGPAGLHEALLRTDPALVAVLPAHNPFGPVLFIVGALALGIGFLGFPHVMIRFMTLKRPGDTVRAIFWYEASFTLLQGLIFLTALSARVLVPEVMTGDPELALPALALALLPEVLVGVILAGIFASAISTADSLVLSASASLSRDVLPRFAEAYGFMKLATAATTLAAMALALGEARSIFDLVTYAGAVMAAGFAPLLCIRAMGRPLQAGTAFTMIAAGVAVASGWRLMGYHQYLLDALPGIVTALAVYAAAEARRRSRRRAAGSGR